MASIGSPIRLAPRALRFAFASAFACAAFVLVAEPRAFAQNPDLAAGPSVTAECRPEGLFVSGSVSNPSAVDVVNFFDVSIYASVDSVLDASDAFLASAPFSGGLAAQTSSNVTGLLDVSRLAAGSYTIFLVVDADDLIAESDETNNVRAASATVALPCAAASPTPSPSPTAQPSATPAGSPTPAGSNDLCANAWPACPGTIYTGTTVGATSDAESPCDAMSSSPDVWYSYRPATTGAVTISLCGSAYDTTLSIYDACPATALNLLGCNDDAVTCGSTARQSALQGTLDAGVTYYIRISGYHAEVGAYQLQVFGAACAPPGPDIDLRPTRMTFNESGNDPIFVELDYMQNDTLSFRPAQDVIDMITRTFAEEGFNITVGVDEAIPLRDMINVVGGTLGTSPDMLDIAAAYFDHAADPRYYYCVFGKNYGFDGTLSTSSGISELPGKFFIVTLGSFSGGTGTFANKVGTFIHEFGHALGQKHGGDSHFNYKPNYISIMNYLYQLDGINASLTSRGFATDPQFNTFGYSRGLAIPLNEADLNETTGLGLNKGIDWNCNSSIGDAHVMKSVGGENHTTSDWCAVTNGTVETLADFNNWESVKGFIRKSTNQPKQTEPVKFDPCVTAEQYQTMKREMREKGLPEPAPVAFDDTKAVFAKANGSFTIYNRGDQTLRVTGMTLDQRAPWIGLPATTAFSIPAGGSAPVNLSVNYAAAPFGESTRVLNIASNDPDENPYPGGVTIITRRTTPVAGASDVVNYLLGRVVSPAGLDHNSDAAVDIADLVKLFSQ